MCEGGDLHADGVLPGGLRGDGDDAHPPQYDAVDEAEEVWGVEAVFKG